MQETITVLQVYPSSQVAKERQYIIGEDGYITLDDGTSYRLRPNCIMLRDNEPYAILSAGEGFVSYHKQIARYFNGVIS